MTQKKKCEMGHLCRADRPFGMFDVGVKNAGTPIIWMMMQSPDEADENPELELCMSSKTTPTKISVPYSSAK